MGEELEQLRADADSTPDGLEVILATADGKATLTVPPPGRWKSRANTALRQGDFDGWAQLVLSDTDWQAWQECDPTNDDVEAFFAAWQEAAGETLGKIVEVGEWLEAHAETVEADLQRWYGIDLADLFRGLLSYRRLWVLVTHLPADSWTQTALRDKAPPQVVDPSVEQRFGPWALINYQIAQLIDSLHRLEYLEAVAGGLTPKPDPPKPVPQPGTSNVRQLRTPEEVAYLQALRAKGE